MRSSGTPAFFQSSKASSSQGSVALPGEDRGRETGGVDAQPLLAGDELPAPGHRVLLEVVAEGEVAEHLEEGVVTGGEPDVLEVVVLAAGADALLGGGGAGVVALLAPGEHVLELDHAGVGEEQRRVVLRDERGALHPAVGALLEEAEEGLADLGGGQGLHVSRSSVGNGLDNRGTRGAATGAAASPASPRAPGPAPPRGAERRAPPPAGPPGSRPTRTHRDRASAGGPPGAHRPRAWPARRPGPPRARRRRRPGRARSAVRRVSAESRSQAASSSRSAHGAHQRPVGGVGRQVALAGGDGDEERQQSAARAGRARRILHRDSRGRVRRNRQTGWPDGEVALLAGRGDLVGVALGEAPRPGGVHEPGLLEPLHRVEGVALHVGPEVEQAARPRAAAGAGWTSRRPRAASARGAASTRDRGSGRGPRRASPAGKRRGASRRASPFSTTRFSSLRCRACSSRSAANLRRCSTATSTRSGWRGPEGERVARRARSRSPAPAPRRRGARSRRPSRGAGRARWALRLGPKRSSPSEVPRRISVIMGVHASRPGRRPLLVAASSPVAGRKREYPPPERYVPADAPLAVVVPAPGNGGPPGGRTLPHHRPGAAGRAAHRGPCRAEGAARLRPARPARHGAGRCRPGRRGGGLARVVRPGGAGAARCSTSPGSTPRWPGWPATAWEPPSASRCSCAGWRWSPSGARARDRRPSPTRRSDRT